MRARGIKPGLYKDEELAKLPFETRWLFPALWMMADCKGRLEDRPGVIRAEAFPFDDFGASKVHHMLQQLADTGFITRYECRGRKYIHIRNFEKHQNPHKNEKEKGSQLPDPPIVDLVPSEDGTSTRVVPFANGSETEPVPESNGSKTEPVGMIHDSRFMIHDSRLMRDETPVPSKPRPKEKPISDRFPEFEQVWTDGTQQSVEMGEAYQAWLSVAYVDVENQIFACLKSYVNSQEVADGAVFRPAKWLFTNHREKWKSRWKARDSPPGGTSDQPPTGLLIV